MRFWEENRSLILALVAALALTGAVRLAIASGANARAREIRGEIAVSIKKLEAYHKPKYPDLTEAEEAYRTEVANLETTLDEFKRRLDWKFPAWVTQTEAEMSFPIHLLTQIERIGRQAPEGTVAREAAERGVALDASWLGFKRRGNWTEAEARRKLKLLAIAENIAVLAYEARVTRIISITPGDPTETGAFHTVKRRKRRRTVTVREPIRVFIREYPVTIRMIGTPESVMRFVHSIRPTKRRAGPGAATDKPGQFLVIRRLTVTSNAQSGGVGNAKNSGKQITVQIEAAGMAFLKDEEIKAAGPVTLKPTEKPPSEIEPRGF